MPTLGLLVERSFMADQILYKLKTDAAIQVDMTRLKWETRDK